MGFNSAFKELRETHHIMSCTDFSFIRYRIYGLDLTDFSDSIVS